MSSTNNTKSTTPLTFDESGLSTPLSTISTTAIVDGHAGHRQNTNAEECLARLEYFDFSPIPAQQQQQLQARGTAQASEVVNDAYAEEDTPSSSGDNVKVVMARRELQQRLEKEALVVDTNMMDDKKA
jgi:hypothetical protein